MEAYVVSKLLALNREFYQTFASSFSRTRQRIQPGVSKMLSHIPSSGEWLDLGCGNGALALEWIRQGRVGRYLGLDYSTNLLGLARSAVSLKKYMKDLNISFNMVDITDPGWTARIPLKEWDGILAFAVLHHIPSQRLRIHLLKQISQLLKKRSEFIFSVWQFQNSPKLMSHRILWTQVGLKEKHVEPGDSLLDWRAEESEPDGQKGLRYVHLFTQSELFGLAHRSGFKIVDSYLSDGKNGILALYQIWQVA